MRKSAAFGRRSLPHPGFQPGWRPMAANAALLRAGPDLWSGPESPSLPESIAFRQTGRLSRLAPSGRQPAAPPPSRLRGLWLKIVCARCPAGFACRGRALLGQAAGGRRHRAQTTLSVCPRLKLKPTRPNGRVGFNFSLGQKALYRPVKIFNCVIA